MQKLKILTNLIFFMIFLVSFKEVSSNNDLSRGFGTEIKWLTFDEAIKIAIKESRPIMIIIHKSWCGACASLKGKLSQSTKFKELSEKFLMVNLQDDEEPNDPKFAPDGNYIPRIFFIDPNGNLRYDLINESGNPKFKYFYSTETQVADVMTRAIKLFRLESPNSQRPIKRKYKNLSNKNKTQKDL